MRFCLKPKFQNIACFLVASLIWAGIHAPVHADNTFKPVIELFTSQGCSSCPDADAFLGTLAARDDVIALTFPVDYWDYLGWKDTFASPQFSERQRAYAAKRGDGEVYTPQVVINGTTHIVGSHTNKIQNTVKSLKTSKTSYDISLILRLDEQTLWIETAQPPSANNASKGIIWLASVSKEKSVAVQKGENGGRTLTYYNVVRHLAAAGQWTGGELKLQLPKKDFMTRKPDFFVILLQEENGGPILGAAQIKAQ